MMYSFSITNQLIVFIESIGFGVLLSMSYSVVDIIVSIFTIGKKKTAICDVIFCLVCAVSLFVFILAYNLGKLRFYIILGIVLGAVAYFTSFGYYTRHICESAVTVIRKSIMLILTPLKRLAASLKNRFITTVKNARKKHDKPKKEKKKIKNLNKAIAKENKSGV